MATQMHPRPDNIPQRPRLTRRALDCMTGDNKAASDWITSTRTWAAWAIEYCKRLDAMYVEHQAIAHEHRVEPGSLSDEDLRYGADNCKVCAYLHEQHEANQL